MKITVLSILLVSFATFTVAQDVTGGSKSSSVDMNQSSPYKIINNQPITVKGEAILVKDGTSKKSEQPPTQKKQDKATSKPIPVKEKSDTKK